ncbi:MAG: hypothetical protein ACN6OX_10560 [Pseudomonas sp.]
MSEIRLLSLPENEHTFGSIKVFGLFEYNPAVTAAGLAFIDGQVDIAADGTSREPAQAQISLVL